MNNKTKVKIILGVMLISGLVFAASITKFYGDIDMQSHKISNLATPTANADGANKTYVDTQITTAVASKLDKSGGTMSGALSMGSQKITDLGTPTASADGATKGYVDLSDSTRLPLNGGTMTGNINMSGHRLYGLPSPSGDSDVATKQYVDNSNVNGSYYQYFALRKGSQYLPLCDLPQSDDTNLTVVILREFQGSITSYYENINASSLPNPSFPYKRYKVGETISVPFKMFADTFTETNGTLVLKGDGGVLLGSFIGNFGITAPPNGITPFTCSVSFNGNTYAPNTAVSIYNNGWDSDNKCFTFKIKNTSGRAISSPSFQFPKVSQYASPTQYSTYTLEFSGSIYSAMPQNITLGGSWANNAELNGKLYILDLDVNTNGLRWQFKVSADGSEYTFGQFFLPNVE